MGFKRPGHGRARMNILLQCLCNMRHVLVGCHLVGHIQSLHQRNTH